MEVEKADNQVPELSLIVALKSVPVVRAEPALVAVLSVSRTSVCLPLSS